MHTYTIFDTQRHDTHTGHLQQYFEDAERELYQCVGAHKPQQECENSEIRGTYRFVSQTLFLRGGEDDSHGDDDRQRERERERESERGIGTNSFGK